MNSIYHQRIKAVIDYIEDHYTEKINLNQLADISHFSKFHFSRIFSSVTGATPIAFLNQKRLEKSIDYLTETDQSILEIAMLCGFGSPSTFNSLFKKHFQLSPSEVRKRQNKESNISQQLSKILEEGHDSLCYSGSVENNFLRRIWSMNITLKELPDYQVAYVRHVGSYLSTGQAWETLMTWASKHEIYPTEHYFIGISLDDPQFVEENKCRYDACVTIPDDFDREPDGDIQFKTLSGGSYALYQFYDTIDKLAIAYQSLFGQWLPSSEYEADDKPCLEFCMNNPFEDPEGKAKVDLYVPIRKLGFAKP